MVSAAPNKCILIGNLKSYQLEVKVPTRFTLELEVLDSKNVEDMPNFATRHIGSIIRASVFEDISHLKPGTVIRCEAEYVGGPFKGRFRVSDIKELHPE